MNTVLYQNKTWRQFLQNYQVVLEMFYGLIQTKVQ